MQKMVTGKSDGQLTQYDCKLELGTSWKWDQDKNVTKTGKVDIGHDCDACTNDDMTLSLTTRTPECECALSCFFSLVSTVSHLAHTHRGRLSSTLLSLFTSRTSCRTSSTTLRAVASLCTPPQRVWTPLTTPTSSQDMSPTASTSRRLRSSPTQSSWTRRRSSPTKGFTRTPTTMTLHSRLCFAKLTEYTAITLNEKTCLSICRRRQCPAGRGDLLSRVARKHRLGLCSTNKQSKFLQSAKQELTDTNFKPLTI